MAMSKADLEKSRDLHIRRERDYKAKAREYTAKAKREHETHQKRSRQLAELAEPKVSMPLARILADSWGYHPPVHDGIDLICPPNEPLLAMCRAKVVRADAAGWWGKGAPKDPALLAKGDGIVIIRSLVDAGPIRKGMNLCYGHAEGATVRVGETVEPGQVIGHAGFANAHHCHFMVNRRDDIKGVGEQDPAPILNHAKENAK